MNMSFTLSTRIAILSALAFTTTGCFLTSAPKPEVAIKEPISAEHIAQSGWEYLEQGAYAAAIPAFQMALSKDASNDRLRFGLAEAYRYAGQAEQAEIQYAKLLNHPEYRIEALCGIGHVKLASYDSNGAFEMFSTAVEEDETAWKASLGMAQLRDLAKDWEAADEAYRSALNHTNDRALVLNNHGVSMLARADAKMALVYFDMAAAIEPHSERINTNIDLAKSAINESADYQEYDHLDGKMRAKKLNNRGYAAMLHGDDEKAEDYFLAAIDAHPSFYAVAHKNLQTLKASKMNNY